MRSQLLNTRVLC